MVPERAKNKGVEASLQARLRDKEMPKLKTHRGAAKRFKKTGTGKIVRASAFKRHILTSKTTKSKRRMRGTQEVSPNDAPKLHRMLPYKGSGF
jgi:large subunit ribosomal protein L35